MALVTRDVMTQIEIMVDSYPVLNFVDWEIRGGDYQSLLARRYNLPLTATRFTFKTKEEAEYALAYVEKLGGKLKPEPEVKPSAMVYFTPIPL